MRKVNMMKIIFMSLVLVFAYAPNIQAEDIVTEAVEEIKSQAQAEAIKATDGSEEHAGEAHESMEDGAEEHAFAINPNPTSGNAQLSFSRCCSGDQQHTHPQC